jgi:hypothetical protein
MEVNEPDCNYSGIYTYADYLKWTIEERLELIKGKIFRMSPAPNTMHQSLSMKIVNPIYNVLRGRQCQVLPPLLTYAFPENPKTIRILLPYCSPTFV